MKTIYPFFGALLLLAVLVAGAACRDETDPNDKEEDLRILARLEADIDLLIGEAACVGDDDCRALPFGEKPCGGPWSYKVFSISATDSVELAGMIDHYNEFNHILNERYGWMSDCMYVMPPAVDCYKGQCVAAPEAGKQGAQSGAQ